MYGGKFVFQSRLSYLIVGRKLTVLAFFYIVFEGNFPSTSLRGAYFRRGDFTEVFLCYEFGGAYTWRGIFSEFYGSFSIGFKYGHIPAVSKAHLLEF